MWPPLVSTEFLTAIAMLVLLIGVPLFVVAVIAVVTGYIQYDADRLLETLEADESGSGGDAGLLEAHEDETGRDDEGETGRGDGRENLEEDERKDPQDGGT